MGCLAHILRTSKLSVRIFKVTSPIPLFFQQNQDCFNQYIFPAVWHTYDSNQMPIRLSCGTKNGWNEKMLYLSFSQDTCPIETSNLFQEHPRLGQPNNLTTLDPSPIQQPPPPPGIVISLIRESQPKPFICHWHPRGIGSKP